MCLNLEPRFVSLLLTRYTRLRRAKDTIEHAHDGRFDKAGGLP